MASPDLPSIDLTSWAAFEASLVQLLDALPDDAFVSIAVPGGESSDGPPGGRHRLLGRGRRDSAAAAGPYTQARRMGDALYVECVGSRRFGGGHDWTPEQEQRLAALGWTHDGPSFGHAVYLFRGPAPAAGSAAGRGPDAVPAARAMTATLSEVCAVPETTLLDVSSG